MMRGLRVREHRSCRRREHVSALACPFSAELASQKWNVSVTIPATPHPSSTAGRYVARSTFRRSCRSTARSDAPSIVMASFWGRPALSTGTRTITPDAFLRPGSGRGRKICVGAAGKIPTGGGSARARALASAQPGPSTTYLGRGGRVVVSTLGAPAEQPASPTTALAMQILQIVISLMPANVPRSRGGRHRAVTNYSSLPCPSAS